MLYSFTKEKRIAGKARNFKDEKWETWTLPVGWPVQGIWAQCYSEGDINAVDRNPNGDVLASGDCFGKIKLFNYPCPNFNSSYNRFVGHSSNVTSVKFSFNGDYLYSVGGHDKTVLQWKVIKNRAENEYPEENDPEIVQRNRDLDELNLEDPEKCFFRTRAIDSKPDEPNPGLQQEINLASPDEYNRLPKSQANSPDANLKIKYVFGYRCYDTRNSVKLTPKGNQMVFISGGLGVVMEQNPKRQSFFCQHETDVVCIAIHPKLNICATGDMVNLDKNSNSQKSSNLATIYVWNIETKNVVSCLRGFHINAVSHLTFSPDGNKLLSFGKDQDHSCAIYDWANQRIIATIKIDRDLVTDACFEGDNKFVTVGTKHIKFWTINGGNVGSKKGRWNSKSEALVSVCICFGQKICCTGGINGRIFTWQNHVCTNNIIAHQDQPVRVLFNVKSILYSGGDDGRIKTWSFSNKFQANSEIIC